MLYTMPAACHHRQSHISEIPDHLLFNSYYSYDYVFPAGCVWPQLCFYIVICDSMSTSCESLKINVAPIVIAEQSCQRVLCNIKQLVKTFSDFSSVFRECVAEHKNPQGISENKTCAGVGIQFSKIPLSFFCFQEKS